ncbi:uncharacterized protein LOC105661949 isoform X1 [Megachile rotundata]|uniref:uncharacterized protein LOC105661949 isoform X1 n=1 Tax=Megachile rotundata TaxID=143995 RepID=UPI003FD1D39F
MDQGKYIEVTIVESEEIPTSDTCSMKASSTNQAHDRSKVHQRLQNVSIFSNIERPSFQRRTDCFNKLDQPLDIDLLLRYYACNSSMEKSINSVLKSINERCLDSVEGCEDTRGPLVELRAASKICDSLKESSSPSSLFRFHDILSKLQRLIGLCSEKKLDEILSNDPSMQMCRHCGVISCSKSLNPVEPRKSPPNTSYFLSTDIFSSSTEIETRKQIKKSNKKEQVKKERYDPQKKFTSKHYKSSKKNCMKQEIVNRRVETMVAERENDSKIPEKVIELLDQKLSPFRREEGMKTDSAIELSQTKIDNIKSKNVIKNNAGANFANGFSSDKRFDDYKQEVDVSCNKNNLNESTERIVKDILYETPKREFEAENLITGSRCNQNRLTSPQENTQLVNVMACLARGRPELLGKRKKELVSQPDETCVHSRCSDQYSFILHAGQTDNARLNLDSFMHEPISEKSRSSKRSSDLRTSRYKNEHKPLKSVESLTCLMEEDSLENCANIAQSTESEISSSSCENMIREWVKSSMDKEIKGQIVSEQSTNRSDAELGIQATSIAQRHYGTHSLKKTWRSMTPRRPQNSFGQTMSLDSKPVQRFKAFRKIESAGGKFFRKQSFELFKKRSTEDMNATIKLPGNHSLGDYFKNIKRRIVYNESSLRKVVDAGIPEEVEALWLYRKVLESTERMEWQSFQRFVEELHPNHKDLWRSICEVINSEARRLEESYSTEVCIEITSASSKESGTCDDEIVFEMDITLEEVKRCLHRQLASTEKAQLDILQRVNEVIKVRNDDVCDTEALFNQAE